MKTDKSQIAVFEMIFATLLLLFLLGNLTFYEVEKSHGIHKLQVESMLNTIYYNEEFRHEFMIENLSNENITGDYSNLTYILNNSFSGYGFKISNESITKIIFSCIEVNGMEITEKIIAIQDNDNYEFRRLTLEVCY